MTGPSSCLRTFLLALNFLFLDPFGPQRTEVAYLPSGYSGIFFNDFSHPSSRGQEKKKGKPVSRVMLETLELVLK